MDRRTFIATGLRATAAVSLFGRAFLGRPATAGHRTFSVGESPYGPLLEPDANGLRLPAGFTSRVLARAGQPVGTSGYVWHAFPDGGATFALPEGGWIYVSNSEVPVVGGAGALVFDGNGQVRDAHRILAGTSLNCAGGATPWGTWLSCEEHPAGHVWECDPAGTVPAVPRPTMGIFSHEATAVDQQGRFYLTEDQSQGRFYRFTPDAPEDLSAGTLEVAAVVGAEQSVSWIEIDPLTAGQQRAPGSTRFEGGEGCWYDPTPDTVYFTTKGNDRVNAYHVESATYEVLFDSKALPGSPLNGVDNMTVSASGDMFICEDNGNAVKDMVMLTPEGTIASFLQLTGQSGSELTGVAFDPSGKRMYFSSQRGDRIGITYDIAGDFRV